MTVVINQGHTRDELRIVLDGGGPTGLELIVLATTDETVLKVWNPKRHEWATLEMQGHGDTRKLGGL